jgi:hypothetical protein
MFFNSILLTVLTIFSFISIQRFFKLFLFKKTLNFIISFNSKVFSVLSKKLLVKNIIKISIIIVRIIIKFGVSPRINQDKTSHIKAHTQVHKFFFAIKYMY